MNDLQESALVALAFGVVGLIALGGIVAVIVLLATRRRNTADRED